MFRNLYMYVCFLFFTSLIDNGSSSFYREFKKRLMLHEYIPKVMSVCPYNMVNVTWDTGEVAWVGNLIPVEKIQQKPWMDWPHNATKYYSVLFTDYDEKAKSHPINMEYQLWWVMNIPGTDIDISKGDERFPYKLPDCSDGPHRVGVTVYEHRKIDLKILDDDAPNYLAATRKSLTALELAFDFQALILGANVFVASPPKIRTSPTGPTEQTFTYSTLKELEELEWQNRTWLLKNPFDGYGPQR